MQLGRTGDDSCLEDQPNKSDDNDMCFPKPCAMAHNVVRHTQSNNDVA